MSLPLRDREHHTYGEYLGWSDGIRYELVDGFAYAMAPAPSVVHQEVVLELARQVADALEGSGCRALIAPLDVRLGHADETDQQIDTVVQPDLLVVCNPARIDERGVHGPPDWIVEVLSPATAAHDQVVKRDLYERHGVREYWLVHPFDRVVTIYRLIDGAYGKPDVLELTGETPVGLLPLVIRWDRVTRRLG